MYNAMQVALHEIKYDIDIFREISACRRLENFSDGDDIVMLKVLQDFDFAIGSFCDNRLLKNGGYLLNCNLSVKMKKHYKGIIQSLTGCSISQNSASVIFRGYLNSASVILIYPRNYRGFRPLCYTLL